MKKRLLLFAIIFLSAASIYAVETASRILNSSANRIKSAKSLVASYVITADGHKQDGIMTISGERFTISSPQMVSWYDGKTQWTYTSHTGEVNITEPTAEELQQINPFAIIRSFSNNYKAQQLKSPAGTKKIRLTALSPKSDIKTVILTLNAKTLYPTRIDLTMGNRQSVAIQISAVEEGPTLPAANFRFDAKKYPGVQVVDLR